MAGFYVRNGSPCQLAVFSVKLPRLAVAQAMRYGKRNAIGYVVYRSRSHDAVIRVYDAAGNVIETHEHTGDFKER
jgi:hypothetical protein